MKSILLYSFLVLLVGCSSTFPSKSIKLSPHITLYAVPDARKECPAKSFACVIKQPYGDLTSGTIQTHYTLIVPARQTRTGLYLDLYALGHEIHHILHWMYPSIFANPDTF